MKLGSHPFDPSQAITPRNFPPVSAAAEQIATEFVELYAQFRSQAQEAFDEHARVIHVLGHRREHTKSEEVEASVRSTMSEIGDLIRQALELLSVPSAVLDQANAGELWLDENVTPADFEDEALSRRLSQLRDEMMPAMQAATARAADLPAEQCQLQGIEDGAMAACELRVSIHGRAQDADEAHEQLGVMVRALEENALTVETLHQYIGDEEGATVVPVSAELSVLFAGEQGWSANWRELMSQMLPQPLRDWEAQLTWLGKCIHVPGTGMVDQRPGTPATYNGI